MDFDKRRVVAFDFEPMKIPKSIFPPLFLAVFLTCGSSPCWSKGEGGDPDSDSEAAPEKGASFKAGEFSFAVIAPWKDHGAQGMVTRTLEYVQKEDSGLENAIAKFYHFGKGQGGSVAANLKRWTGQFRGNPEVEKEEMKFGARTVQLAKIKGTFLSGPQFGQKVPKQGWALLGAILPSEEGPVFIKITGAERSVMAIEPAIRKLIASAFTPAPKK